MNDVSEIRTSTDNEPNCKTEEDMKMDIDTVPPSETKSEGKLWNRDSKESDYLNEIKLKNSSLGSSQKSPVKVIDTQDVEQLLLERNQMVKIAYDVCCMFIDDQNFNCNQDSADSGISEQEEQQVTENSLKNKSKRCDEVAVVPARVTRSQSKAAETVETSTQKTESNPVFSMENFLSLNNDAFQKAMLNAVKGTEVGALLNELEQQREENNRLEKYLIELEQRRNTLKLYYATTQNLIFQSDHEGTQIQT
ncbi:uncharacterized protein LOC135936278 [Cloeon dipterum]|uniref:uncharacterized protein LOC135936278 n=1 Tax=Cloeon dipterum TaxID=197152 RepID=UPI00321F92B4